MDYQNAEFYKLNKNTPDLVYNFADEVITYGNDPLHIMSLLKIQLSDFLSCAL